MIKTVKPAETYDSLLKQFFALKTLVVCTEARLSYYENERSLEHLARVQLESERAANEILTNEVERLQELLECVKKNVGEKP